MISPTYVDVHILQSVPPSNMNRDDAGSPKQAIYGGTRRARVSSQAWKRATRKAFAEQIPERDLGTRTKKISALLADRLVARTGVDDEAAARIATTLLKPLGIKPGKRKTAETSYLLFFGYAQLDAVIDVVVGRVPKLVGLDDAALEKAVVDVSVRNYLGAGHAIDVALFGRMVANIPDLNVDAATQVAHAISTHQVEVEFDYYTAVDDESPREEAGAAMIGTVEFNSATFYRFATVGLHQLVENLGGDIETAGTALQLFLKTFTTSMPTGHETSFAHRTLPGLVSVVVRGDQPVNLVSAFETPVWSTHGMLTQSADRLADELRRTTEMWNLEPIAVASSFAVPDGDGDKLRSALGPSLPFDDLVASIAATSRARMNGAAQ